MNIAIISERLSRPSTGVTTYLYNLITNLSDICLNDEIFLIDCEENSSFPTMNKIIVAPFFNFLPKKSYFWNFYIQCKLLFCNYDLDIIHSPENAIFFMKLKDVKKVVTIHDSMYLFPESTTLISKLRYKFIMPRVIHTSDKIIAVSYNIKKDLITSFGVNESKIEVIYEAAHEKFKPLPKNEINFIKKKYNLKFPFILYVGLITMHKNISTLIHAYSKLKCRGLRHKLVIVGPKGWKSNGIYKLVKELNLQNDIIFTGKIEDDLPAIYNAADVFVYPSLYEGFGLAPLEAMACGVPVITSNTSSFPEIVGDAGIMINPYDIDGFVESIYSVLTDPVLREFMINKGFNNVKKFSWDKCAKETLSVYDKVHHGI